jgi:hypothetical protein
MAAAEQRSLALEARQAEQWAQQQAALRQMHADQVAAIQDAILKLDDERSAWQQQALRQIQQASTDQLPAALRQLQDELAGRQQQTLNQLRDDLLRHQAEAAAAPAAPGAVPAGQPRDMVELNWQLENNAVSTQDLRQRVGQLLWVNVVLIVALVALALGAFWVLRGGLVPAPTPTSTAAPTFTPIPPTTVPPTPVPPTDVPAPTATQPPTATARPAFLAALSCANADRPRNFYDCAITNDAAVTDTLALAVQVEGEALNGFRPVVMDENQERITPDADTGLFRLDAMRPRETRQVRVLMPCTVVAGCAETTFAITPLVDGGQTIVTDQIVYVTTHYFPPDAP